MAEVKDNKNTYFPDKFLVSDAPHVKAKVSTRTIMTDVIIALVPSMIAAIYFFTMRAALLILVSVISCVAFEALFQKIVGQKSTISDRSAIVTGILLAFNVPVTMPIWKLIFGSFFAIIIVKQLFGGIGANFMNPALAARAMLMASWATDMTNYVRPFDLVSSATPLGGAEVSTMDLFLGNCGGVLGETSALAILIGFCYLLIRKVVSWETPVFFVGSAAIFALVFGTPASELLNYILSGGLLLGACFMATDYATVPITKKGKCIFALACGFLTALIRAYGGYPEGVSYSILIMNVFTPFIDRFTAPKVFGLKEAEK